MTTEEVLLGFLLSIVIALVIAFALHSSRVVRNAVYPLLIGSQAVPIVVVNALSIAKSRGLQADSQLLRFSLLQLPVNVQGVYKILLTVPIGAFIILILRNFIGLKTFGTFMPVLIALAFRETHVVWGISLFVIIVSFGLLARFYLDQLKLLLVPRLDAFATR